ncbi:LOW QUALITY PROTEIN: complement C1r subcomponent-like [Rhinophrynus dorsalis]
MRWIKRSYWYFWVFLLVGTVVCSSEKRPLFGLVKSPNYPKPYPNNNQTSWDIEVPEGYRVSLTFLVFDIEPSENCDYDFVKVLADQRELGLFCGSAMSRTHPGSRRFVSQGKKMRIQFHSDFSNEENGTTIPYRGFQAYYQAIDRDECADPYDNSISWTPPCQQMCHNYVGGYFCSCLPGYQMQNDQRSCRVQCSNEMFTEESGSFSSPGYPQPYPPDLNCKYSIRLEQGMLISLSFQQLFEIDDHLQVHCPYDTLKIFAGENLLDSFCGSRSPGILMTNSNTVDIIFQTDESGDSRGWRLDYTSEAIQCPNPVPRDQFSLISPTKKEYRMGDYIVVSCQTGYKLMEDNTELRSFTSLCQKDGTWHRVIPRCEIVSCKDPKPVTNGQIIFQTAPDRLTYQSVIQYHCNTPYYKMGTPIDTDQSPQPIPQYPAAQSPHPSEVAIIPSSHHLIPAMFWLPSINYGSLGAPSSQMLPLWSKESSLTPIPEGRITAIHPALPEVPTPTDSMPRATTAFVQLRIPGLDDLTCSPRSTRSRTSRIATSQLLDLPDSVYDRLLRHHPANFRRDDSVTTAQDSPAFWVPITLVGSGGIFSSKRSKPPTGDPAGGNMAELYQYAPLAALKNLVNKRGHNALGLRKQQILVDTDAETAALARQTELPAEDNPTLFSDSPAPPGRMFEGEDPVTSIVTQRLALYGPNPSIEIVNRIMAQAQEDLARSLPGASSPRHSLMLETHSESGRMGLPEPARTARCLREQPPDVCGKPGNPVTSSTKIIGGKVAEPGNFPWQVLVLVNNQRAGGFLIGEHWVLTAAHNLWSSLFDKPVNDLSKVHVFLGDVEVEKQIGLGNHPVEELYLHPDYNSRNHDNDIALIRLQYPVVMNQNVAPICLPDPKNENFVYQANRIGYVSGYGITEHHSISNSLRYVKVPMVSREECQTYVDNVPGANKVFTPNMICAGYPEMKHLQGDSCEGDSGGAYTTQNQEDTWVATGIVSWGIGCGRGYGIYTKVNNYVNWIQGYMMSQ